MDRYYTVLFGVSRSIGICSQVLSFALYSFFLSQMDLIFFPWIFSDLFLFVVIANMGSSSWVGTGEAEERDHGMA